MAPDASHSARWPARGHAVQFRAHRERAQHQGGERSTRQQGLGVTGDPLGQHRQRDRMARVAGMQELKDPYGLVELELVVPAHQPGDAAVGPQRRQPRPVPGFGGEHRTGGRRDGGLASPCFPIPLGRPVAQRPAERLERVPQARAVPPA
jgi:hypothetical protein